MSATIFRFLLGFNLWKWLLWTIFAFRLARLNLKLVPSHPDENGGLGFLSLSPQAFALIAFAATIVIGATFRHQILHNGAHLMDFKLPAERVPGEGSAVPCAVEVATGCTGSASSPRAAPGRAG